MDLGQELFGRPLPAPVLLAPAAYQRLMHAEGELGSVQGAIRHGVPFVLSSNGTVSIEEITAVPGARCWFQLYVQGLVEEAFRSLKTVQLEVRPVYHKTDDRIRSHVFLCTLAYYLQWHLKQRLEPLFAADGAHKDRQWTVRNVIERLAAIRRDKIVRKSG